MVNLRKVHVLRAKIDMASSNMLMRDPIMYRILHKHHHRSGDKWCIYPMYDWAHGESDYLEAVSHSLCTLEFMMHRELYDWFLDQIYDNANTRPKQREFARRNLSHTVVSKRKLLQLVQENYVTGWDDPRMSTISGMRRRGYPPQAIVNFADTIGIAKRTNLVDVSVLNFVYARSLTKPLTRNGSFRSCKTGYYKLKVRGMAGILKMNLQVSASSFVVSC
jgi:glutaminyl-tRNA synthetase